MDEKIEESQTKISILTFMMLSDKTKSGTSQEETLNLNQALVSVAFRILYELGADVIANLQADSEAVKYISNCNFMTLSETQAVTCTFKQPKNVSAESILFGDDPIDQAMLSNRRLTRY